MSASTRASPTCGHSASSEETTPSFLSDMQPSVAVAAVARGFRMARPKACPAGLYDLLLQCWQAEPANRPAFSALERSLSDLLDRLHDSGESHL
eukprot:m.715726 g.715726  ORF g.715726 m.715726 type:complete len:94 (-) comp58790_c0_seq15:1003-1284(-)